MERPERYDPEDLEHLMLERGFDELLAEERAFALRHLNDRGEYERMRALLLLVQDHRHTTSGPPEADTAVREHVLHTFRMGHQPTWRIWLNSIGAFLLPEKPAAYWRPALALAVVALVGVALVRLTLPGEPAKVLAEAKPLPAAATDQVPPAQAPAPQPAQATEPTSANGIVDNPMPTEAAAMETSAADDDAALRQSEALRSEPRSAVAVPVPEGLAATTSPAQTLDKEAYAVSESYSDKERPGSSWMQDSIEPTAMGRSKASLSEAAKRRSAATYTEDDLLGLLNAAW